MMTPSFSKTGSTSSSRTLYCSSTIREICWEIFSSWTLGVVRSAPEDRVMPAWTFCSSPPTRTMKNSSRFDEKIARNFSRSMNGTRLSCASSSTRRLNSSHDNSRLM